MSYPVLGELCRNRSQAAFFVRSFGCALFDFVEVMLMRKVFKKAISVLLVAVMVLGAAPLSGFMGLELPEFNGFKKIADSMSNLFVGFTTKAEAATYNGTCGESLKWYLDTSTGLLSITGTGKMTDYSNRSERPWDKFYIKDVYIENGVESIGDYAFAFTELKSFVIPDSVTRVGSQAIFARSTVLLPDSVTDLGDDAIYYVDGNGNYGYPQIYYTGSPEKCKVLIKDQKPMMASCVHYLQENEAWFRVESYKVNASGIYVLDSRRFYSGVIDEEILFTPENERGYDVNKSLSSLTSVITADSMAVIKVYYDKIDIPVTGVTLNKTSKTLAIDGVLNLSHTIKPSDATNKSVTWSSSDTNIATVSNSGVVTAKNEGIATIRVKTTDGGYTAACVINVCKKFEFNNYSYIIENGQAIIIDYEESFCGGITIPSTLGGYPVIEIGEFAFDYCTNLTSIIIPESVRIIGMYAFNGCTGLTEIIIPDNVTSIGFEAFGRCSSLKSIEIPNEVTCIDVHMFFNCVSLESVVIPNSVTQIGLGAFDNCPNLRDVHYIGTEEQWNNIVISSRNEYLTSANVRYSKPISVINISLNKTSATLKIEDTYQLIQTVNPSDATNKSVTWSSSNTNVATVSGYGLVVAKDEGTATITVKTSDGGYTAKCVITVKEKLRLNQESVLISNNVCPEIKVVEYPNGVTADDLVWSSSNDDVAYVNEDNVVTPLHYGKTDITVSTVDGKYSATCEVTVEASFVITSALYSIKSIRCDDISEYRIYLYDYNAEKLSVDMVELSVGDNEVLEIVEKNIIDNYINLKIKAKSEGTGIIEVYSEEPLAYNKFLINVYPKNEEWLAEQVPNLGKEDKQNFSRSTFIVENFTYIQNRDTYTVSMDVYNMAGDYPVLAAYDSSGAMVDFDAADRFVSMPGDWIEFFGTLGFGMVQMMNGDLFTYKSVTRSKKSTVSVEVPTDGYVTISNDITVCPAATMFNLSNLVIDVVFQVVSSASDIDPSDNDKKSVTKEFIKSLKKKCLDFDEIVYRIMMDFSEESIKKMTPESLVSLTLFSKEAIYDFCDKAGSSFEEILGEVVLNVLDENIKGLVSKSSVEYLIKNKLADAASFAQLKAADKYFEAGQLLGLIDFALNTLCFNLKSGFTSIQFNPSGEYGFVCKDEVKVVSDIIDEEVLLHHFVIRDSKKLEPMVKTIEVDLGNVVKIIEMHEISLIKNGKKIENVTFQATVEMSIPKGLDPRTTSVYRVEKNGTLTRLKTTIEKGKIIFITDHFSEYIIAGRAIDDVVIGVSLNTDDLEIINKQTYQLFATVFPETASNKTIVWSSDNEEVATVDENGLLTAKSLGTALITATTVDGSYSASCKVTVLPREFNVTWIVDSVETVKTENECAIITKPSDPEKLGYTFTGWTPEVPDVMPTQDLEFTAVFTPNTYNAVFDANGGAWADGAEAITVSTEFDTEIIAPKNPSKQGYVFSKWTPEVGKMDDINGKLFAAEWLPTTDTVYTVETYKMNTAGEYEKSVRTFAETTDSTVTAEYTVENGFALNKECSVLSGIVAADNSLVLKVYIDRNTYVFETIVDGVSTETEYLYGSIIAEPSVPVKQDYKFIEWNPEIPETMPAEKVTVTAIFKKAYICLECGNEILGEDAINEHIADETVVTISSGTVVSGELKPYSTITAKADQIDGKVFKCWTIEGATASDANSSETTIVLDSGKISITAEYDDCECKCHQSGVVGFFYKIVLFFQKLFGNNLECFCGTKH